MEAGRACSSGGTPDGYRDRRRISSETGGQEWLFGTFWRPRWRCALRRSTRELLAALAAYPDVKAEWKAGPSSALPTIPLSRAWNGNILRYFSLVTTVGMPQSTAAQELRLECLFPADEATESGHVQMLGEEPALIGRR